MYELIEVTDNELTTTKCEHCGANIRYEVHISNGETTLVVGTKCASHFISADESKAAKATERAMIRTAKKAELKALRIEWRKIQSETPFVTRQELGLLKVDIDKATELKKAIAAVKAA